MEDRTESIIRQADKWDAYLKSRRGREPTINSKVVYIQKLAENRKDPLHKYFSDNLLADTLDWKDERNRLIHALLKQQLEHNEIKMLAEEGRRLADELRKRAGNYNRTIDRRKTKEAR